MRKEDNDRRLGLLEENGDSKMSNKEKQKSTKEIQKEQIQLAKELFLIWDGDGEGSLSPDEIMKAFIQLGLSQDYQFANKIM